MSSIVYIVGAVVIIGVVLKMLGAYEGAGRSRAAPRGSGGPDGVRAAREGPRRGWVALEPVGGDVERSHT